MNCFTHPHHNFAGVQGAKYSNSKGNGLWAIPSASSYAWHRNPKWAIHRNALSWFSATNRKFISTQPSFPGFPFFSTTCFPLASSHCLLTLLFVFDWWIFFTEKKRGNAITLMDYYYTMHEVVVVVAKLFLLLADEPFPAESGGTWNHCSLSSSYDLLPMAQKKIQRNQWQHKRIIAHIYTSFLCYSASFSLFIEENFLEFLMRNQKNTKKRRKTRSNRVVVDTQRFGNLKNFHKEQIQAECGRTRFFYVLAHHTWLLRSLALRTQFLKFLVVTSRNKETKSFTRCSLFGELEENFFGL